MTDRPTNNEREALISEGRDGALEPDEAAEVALLADLLADPSTWAEPETEFEDTILRAVADAEPAPATTAPEQVRDLRYMRASRRRRIALSVLAAAAAVLIVVAAVTTLESGTSSDFDVALRGTELAQTATGSGAIVETDSGFRITLDARGLPPLGPDEYYQGWLKNTSGMLVPIGTFSSGDDRVTLWSGVSPADYPAMTVTIETADNEQSSSGRRVLEGTLRAG